MQLRLVCALLAASLLGGAAFVQATPTAVSQIPEKSRSADEGDVTGMNGPYLAACLAALSHGEISRGVEFCNLALFIDPDDPGAMELRGYGFLMQHRFDRAEEDFRAALKVQPQNAEMLAGLGQSLVGQNRYPEAVRYFSQAVTLEPANPAFLNGLCWARAAAGRDLNLAIADCRTAVMLAPEAPAPLNSRGLVELRMGWFAEAIEDYTLSLSIRSTQSSAYFGRGLARLKLRQTAAGVADILQARARDTEIDAMFIAMGIIAKDCDGKPKVKCPAGFPPLQRTDGLIARWFAR
jgi:Flp pilus assembly protein TadD